MMNADADDEYQSRASNRPTYEERLFEPKDLSWRRFFNVMEINLSRNVTLILAVLMFL